MHIYYGEGGEQNPGMQRRVGEIERLTDFLARRARDEQDSDADAAFLVLGDFNVVGKQHRTMGALTRRGFVVPEAIREIPAGTNVDRTKFYDQIAYHRRRGQPPASTSYARACSTSSTTCTGTESDTRTHTTRSISCRGCARTSRRGVRGGTGAGGRFRCRTTCRCGWSCAGWGSRRFSGRWLVSADCGGAQRVLYHLVERPIEVRLAA